MEVFNIGLRIGKYELTRKLAEGGFGTLFVARDTELDRDLVIKFLLPEHANNDQVVQRFLQEGRSLAKIVHPGIVTVYETGEVRGSGTKADGSAFIIMEFLAGETLSQRLKRVGRMSVSAAMEVCRQVANALQAAHEQGIVHRDLKPDNIMLVKDAALSIGERAKVLDFGIAKLAKSVNQNSNATQDGLVFGTPVYMSPEQAKSTASAGPASDIYSLGCILFELLVGRTPFTGSMVELIAHHILTAPPVPSNLAPGIPPHLDQVIGAMMAKSPEERPATMKVVEAILEEKRVVASMSRRRTLGGAKLVTQPPPMSGSPASSLAAAAAPIIANAVTPVVGTPVHTPMPMPVAAPSHTPMPMAAASPMASPTPMPVPMMAPAPMYAAPTQAHAVPVAPSQWPASSAPQAIAHPIATQPAMQVPEVIKPSHPTTLSAAAGVTTPTPAKKGGGKFLFAAIATVVLAGGGIAAVALTGGDKETTPAASPDDTVAKPVDTKPVDTKPVDTKPVETTTATKPVDTKPVDTKAIDTKAVDTKTTTTAKPVDTKITTTTAKPVDTTTTAKPVDTKTTTTTTAKPVDTKTTTTTTAKPVDTKTTTTTAKPVDTKTTTTKPVDTKTTTKPTEIKPKCQGKQCTFDGSF